MKKAPSPETSASDPFSPEMSEDFSVATAAEGDKSSRSIKQLAALKEKIKPAKSAWACYQAWYFK